MVDPFHLVRFLSFVSSEGLADDECWEWTGPINSNGYGRFPENSTLNLAHRVSRETRTSAIIATIGAV
jgi:hypothetical protein